MSRTVSPFRPRKIQGTTAVLLMAVIATLMFASVAFADDIYGRIRGTVTDPSGAVVPGATVTATNVATGVSKTATTDATGGYELPNLVAPGTYTIKIEKSGFTTYQAQGVQLRLNQIYVANAQMQVGQASQTVNVEASAAQVDTTSMQLSAVVQGQTIVDMPLNGRNWVQLQQTLPGVVASSDRFGSNYATNGSQSQQNSYLVNGMDTNDLPLNTPLVIPSPDAIGQFNMVTSTINPEYGRNSGAILNAVIKNGTNGFHGSLFDFYRDTSLNTKPFFSKKPAVFHQNQFGGTIGGPIVKNHAFFFFSYQGTRARQPQSGGDTQVLTNAERNGDFSGDVPKGCSANVLACSSGVSPFRDWRFRGRNAVLDHLRERQDSDLGLQSHFGETAVDLHPTVELQHP